MKIFKFGGASVKDAESIKNVAVVLETENFSNCLIVVSAMGKTTNALEEVVKNYFEKRNYESVVEEVKANHLKLRQNFFQKTILF